MSRECFALDPGCPVTSVREDEAAGHVHVTVRWLHATCGVLVVDVRNVAKLRDWLMPCGHTEVRS